MNPDKFDEDGYPTPEALKAIEDADVCNDALDLLRETWNTRYGTVSEDLSDGEKEVVYIFDGRRHVRFTTGGWSGNEEALAAFRKNWLAYFMTWCLSAAGGLHIFQYLGVD